MISFIFSLFGNFFLLHFSDQQGDEVCVLNPSSWSDSLYYHVKDLKSYRKIHQIRFLKSQFWSNLKSQWGIFGILLDFHAHNEDNAGFFFFKKLVYELAYLFTIFNETSVCFRPHCFRLYLSSRRTPRSRRLPVSRARRWWPTSSSSCWSCRSRGQWRPASRPRPPSSWASPWASTRTSCRWDALPLLSVSARARVIAGSQCSGLIAVETSSRKIVS